MAFQVLTNVVGVTFDNEDGKPRQTILEGVLEWASLDPLDATFDRRRDVSVDARREPDNPYDPNAIAIHITSPEHLRGRIGYIAMWEAAKLAPTFDAGKYLGCSLHSVGRGFSGNVGARVFLRFNP